MKKILAIVLSAIMLLSLVACGGSSSTPVSSSPAASVPQEAPSSAAPVEAKKKIGMCAMSLAFDFQIQMSDGIERAAQENGYEYMVYDYNGDAE